MTYFPKTSREFLRAKRQFHFKLYIFVPMGTSVDITIAIRISIIVERRSPETRFLVAREAEKLILSKHFYSTKLAMNRNKFQNYLTVSYYTTWCENFLC